MSYDEYHGEVRSRAYRPKDAAPASKPVESVALDHRKLKYRSGHDTREDVTHHRWDYEGHHVIKKQYGGTHAAADRARYAEIREAAIAELIDKIRGATK